MRDVSSVVAREQVVIARYSEDVRWAESLPAVVYNKGLAIATPLEQRFLPNVGRESHTFLYHIVNHWNDLADWTIFVQGRFADHFPCGVRIEQFFDASIDVIVPRLVRCREWDEAGRLIHWGLWKQKFEAGSMSPARLSLIDWFRTYIELNPNEEGALIYTPGANFAVKSECIRRRPLDFYQRMLGSVDHHVDPEEAYYIERGWIYMFTPPAVRIRNLSG